MDILKKAREIEDVIHLEIGEPDLPPSPKVKEAAINALKNNKFHYTQSKGVLELREKISKHYKHFYNLNVNPQNIIITTGTSTAFLIALYFSKRVAAFTPGYPCYENFAELENKTFIKLNSPNELKNGGFDTLLISSPNNPTGYTFDKNELKKIYSYCKENNVLLISDELYHGFVYEKDYTTALEFGDCIVINGFSKFFCMPGFRLGWMIVPDSLLRDAEIIAQNILISAPTISQYAAMEAFDYQYLKQIKSEFKKRRDFLYNELKDIFNISKPDGAFYLWCDISKYSDNSYDFALKMLNKAKVAITPGIDFGNYPTHIRIAYTQEIEKLQKAVERIKKFIKNL
ncbi:MAG: aminotransferase class I/II-fold pyridoxal phosphate-dependent enzyme [Epsilonproteobacteria bacterium]|nr:aminotransferase class I/II-fold pyridoxal phosphate-dependent enzyme [Campylobacterota bacterium]